MTTPRMHPDDLTVIIGAGLFHRRGPNSHVDRLCLAEAEFYVDAARKELARTAKPEPEAPAPEMVPNPCAGLSFVTPDFAAEATGFRDRLVKRTMDAVVKKEEVAIVAAIKAEGAREEREAAWGRIERACAGSQATRASFDHLKDIIRQAVLDPKEAANG